MEKSIYIYGLKRIEATCYFEILDANTGKFIASGERSGDQFTVGRELTAQESTQGDKVKVNVRLSLIHFYDADV